MGKQGVKVENFMLHINGHTYDAGKTTVERVMNMAKQKYEQEKANAVYALEKDNYFEMRRDTFLVSSALERHIKLYERAGFIVHAVKEGLPYEPGCCIKMGKDGAK